MYSYARIVHIVCTLIWIGGSVSLSLLTIALAGQQRGTSEIYAAIRRLWVRTTSPAMLLVWGLGLAMAQNGAGFAPLWVRTKLLLALAVTAWHGAFSGQLRRLIMHPHTTLPRAWLWMTLLVIGSALFAVTMVVLKPLNMS